jgi:hypothetical protein
MGEKQEGHELSCPYEERGNPRGRGEPRPYKGEGIRRTWRGLVVDVGFGFELG